MAKIHKLFLSQVQQKLPRIDNICGLFRAQPTSTSQVFSAFTKILTKWKITNKENTAKYGNGKYVSLIFFNILLFKYTV